MKGAKIMTSSELTLLGAPIFPEAIETVLEPKLENLKLMTKRLQEIDSHEGLFLLRHCFGIPKLTYFLRTSPCADSTVLRDMTLVCGTAWKKY